ncbi:MAG: tryptophanase [Clostridiales bacterium]|nr:tryptophanase [Clostridiales bacterium]
MKPTYIAEPFRIKSVEPLNMLTRAEREQKIKEAHYNVFGLNSQDVYIDCLTDSGTNAMSAQQWAGVMMGDESYAGATSYQHVIESATDIFGIPYIQPVHQGRAAEKVLLPILMEGKRYAIANMFFDTTRGHAVMAGGIPVDCVVPEALDSEVRVPFKGNMDCAKLKELIKEYGKDNIGVIIMTITNNSAGGQPVSVANIREASKIAHDNGIPFMIDAARYAENAYFIKQREEEFKNASIKEIIRECFSHADYFTMSAKKDAIVNMGGLLGTRDKKVFEVIKQRCISFEGFITYGGMSGRDLEALAIGLKEGINEDYLRYRIGQLEYMAARLDEAGIAYQAPVGGHALFIDAKKMLPHIPWYEYPAQALTVQLYIEAGIRGCDIGSYMLDRDPVTHEEQQSKFEFTRLCIARRVYTRAHLDIIVDALIEVKKNADKIKGLKIIEEAPVLRHFTGKLELLK